MAPLVRVIAAIAILYASWLAMMAVHELGHVVHAMCSGGKVQDVSLPLLGFSQTIVHPNPREHFVVWGGPIWGAMLPAGACAGLQLSGLRRRRASAFMRFFAGFCLVANGIYVGVGWAWRAGDTGEMLRLGTPLWLMIAFGAACIAGGFATWHTLGSVSDFVLPAHRRAASGRPSRRA